MKKLYTPNPPPIFIFIFILIFIAPAESIQAQIYVKQTATGNNDGTSWNNAFVDLQDALAIATNGSEIWVAKGIYQPTTCDGECDVNDQRVAFEVIEGVKIYGGFEGNETQIEQRDWVLHKSILSGDIGIGGDSLDNSFNVLKMENVTGNTVLDGLVIQDGFNPDNISTTTFGGAGIYLFTGTGAGGNGSPRIENCLIRNNFGSRVGAIRFLVSEGATVRPLFRNTTFEGNKTEISSLGSGGAVSITSQHGSNVHPQFIGCRFRNNVAGSSGGALHIRIFQGFSDTAGDLGMLVDSCHFENNRVIGTFPDGGAIHIEGFGIGEMDNIIRRSYFIDNQSNEWGGALSISGGNASFTMRNQVVNSYFSGNSSKNVAASGLIGGGAVMIRDFTDSDNNSRLINCLFYDNRSATQGGAIYSLGSRAEATTPNVEIINCSFARNQAAAGGHAVYVDAFNGLNHVDLVNNIFADEAADDGDSEIKRNGGTVTISNCLVKAGLPTNVTDNGNNLVADPLFFDAVNDDLHILPSSPAANSGDNSAIPPDVNEDFDRNLRIRQAVVDMGAIETGVIYVDENATGNNTGYTWEDAFVDLQDALAKTQVDKEIWVAMGTYRPTQCAGDCTVEERQLSFFVADSVKLYGGFNATETERGQRNWEVNETILSGDIGVAGDSLDNTYSVIQMTGSSDQTIIDGVIIEDGNSNGSFDESTPGGGISIDLLNDPFKRAAFRMRNTVVRNNYSGGGGGISLLGRNGEVTPVFANTVFEGNKCSIHVFSRGAAVQIFGASFLGPKFINCRFINNSSGASGGGLAFTTTASGSDDEKSSRILIDSCLFENNEAGGSGRGGAVYTNSLFTQNQLVIRNSAFIDNSSQSGGAIYSSVRFEGGENNDHYINNTFRGNSAAEFGGGIYLRGYLQGKNSSIVMNNLFVGNTAAERGGAVYNLGTFNGLAENIGMCIPEIVNNTFINNQATAGGNTFFNEFAEPTIANNIILGDTGHVLSDENSAPVLINNIIEGGYDGPGTQSGTTSEVPQFIDSEGENYNLFPCSVGVNEGDNDAIPTPSIDIVYKVDLNEFAGIDFEGKTRIFDNTVDIGAFEWTGDPVKLDSIAFETQPPSFVENCDGSIEAVPFNGTPEYAFDWSNGDTTAVITDLCQDTYILTVTDAKGCQFTDSVFLEALPNTVPEFTSDSVVTALEDELYSYSIIAEDPDEGETLIISIESLPDWLEVTDNGDGTALLSGTPANDDVGTYSIRLTVTDSKGETDTQEFILEVINVNDPPAITSNPDTIATVGIEYVYTILAEDEDEADTILFSMPFIPSWLELIDNDNGTATLSGTPDLGDVGSYSLTVFVTDAQGASGTQEFTLTVIDENSPPAFTSTPVTEATVGVNYTYLINATDADGDSLVFSMPFLPAWLNFTDNGDGTALLNGVPQPVNTGGFTLQIFVEDLSGAEAIQEFEITVSDPNVENTPPEISDLTLETNEDQPLLITKNDFTGHFSDAENDAMGDLFVESLPLNGVLLLNGNPVRQPTSFSTTVAFELTYEPNENFNGSDQWSWNANDGNLQAADVAVVNIEVLPVNDSPVNLTLSNNIITENALIGDLVGNLETEDVDADDLHTFYFSDNNSDDTVFFVIEGNQLLVNETLGFREQNTFTIEITVEDEAGDTFSAQFQIIVEPGPVTVAANGITPNGDGINDVWLVPELANCPQCKVEIYNRWGQLLFSSLGYGQPWDGRYQQKVLPTGTYYYLIDFGDDRLSKTGTVTILK